MLVFNIVLVFHEVQLLFFYLNIQYVNCYYIWLRFESVTINLSSFVNNVNNALYYRPNMRG